MYASKYVFGRGFFIAWIVVSIIWVWCTMLITGFYPILDGWRQLRQVYQGVRRKPDQYPSDSETNSNAGPALEFVSEGKASTAG